MFIGTHCIIEYRLSFIIIRFMLTWWQLKSTFFHKKRPALFFFQIFVKLTDNFKLVRVSLLDCGRRPIDSASFPIYQNCLQHWANFSSIKDCVLFRFFFVCFKPILPIHKRFKIKCYLFLKLSVTSLALVPQTIYNFLFV